MNNVTTIDPRTLSHRHDPETSQIAAQRHVDSKANEHQREHVLACLRKYFGCTSSELAQHFSLDRFMVARRLPDLEKLGLAYKGNKRICAVSGSLCVTWYPKDLPEAA